MGNQPLFAISNLKIAKLFDCTKEPILPSFFLVISHTVFVYSVPFTHISSNLHIFYAFYNPSNCFFYPVFLHKILHRIVFLTSVCNGNALCVHLSLSKIHFCNSAYSIPAFYEIQGRLRLSACPEAPHLVSDCAVFPCCSPRTLNEIPFCNILCAILLYNVYGI